MNLGKRIRLKRLFAHPSQRLCSVAIDHFIGYGPGFPAGLRQIQATLDAVMQAQPDAVTMHKGMATSLWRLYAGTVPLIIQSSLVRPDDAAQEQVATVEEVVRLGADAIAVVAYVRGRTEAAYLRSVADCVREAARFEMPVICHIYPRDPESGKIVFDPENIAWAARGAVEVGADVVKTPYCGDVQSYAQIVAECPVPLVAAGGPQADSLRSALVMMADVVRAAREHTIGRNIWGVPQITESLRAFQAVVHQQASADEALRLAGLNV